ncbi:Histone-lysine N-methyltransferase SMYD3 [Halotydeus destructor]|nr:Histone-lysine N-methyltransferase SMYD3 [Halotydeus destructor]
MSSAHLSLKPSSWLCTAVSDALEKSQITFDKKTFAELDNIRDMVAFVRQDDTIAAIMEALADDMLAIGQSQDRNKSRALYKKYISLGYKDVNRRNYQQALDKFNMAALNASHGNLELCKMFAARSLAFYHLNRFTDCLFDIDYAIKANYPTEDLAEELLPRRLKCLSACGQIDKLAQEICSIKRLVDANPKNEVYKKLIDLGIKLISSDSLPLEDLSWFKMGADFMDIVLDKNKYICSANASLTIDKDEVKGKMLRTVKSMVMGSDVISEQAYVTVIEASHKAHRCGHCSLSVAERFYPCSQCTMVRYCSIDCLKLDKVHQVLCEYDRLEEIWPTGALVLKLLWHRAEEKYDEAANQSTVWTKISNLVFRKTHERNYGSLITLSATIPVKAETKLLNTFHAIILSSVARKIMPNLLNCEDGQLNQDVLQLIFITDCCKVKLIDDRNNVDGCYGYGLYSTFSLLNHSCDSNCNYVTYGGAIYVQANRDIEADQELTINYGTVRDDMVEKRRRFLCDNFCFNCNCDLCENED